MHNHSVNGIAVSAQAVGLLTLSQQSLFVLGSIAYHDFEGIALQKAERVTLALDLGDKQ